MASLHSCAHCNGVPDTEWGLNDGGKTYQKRGMVLSHEPKKTNPTSPLHPSPAALDTRDSNRLRYAQRSNGKACSVPAPKATHPNPPRLDRGRRFEAHAAAQSHPQLSAP